MWGGIFPTTPTGFRNLGDKLYLDHIGYTSTIIAFYFVPFFLFKGKDLSTEEGKNAAKLCAINIIAQAKKACNGKLDDIVNCIKL